MRAKFKYKMARKIMMAWRTNTIMGTSTIEETGKIKPNQTILPQKKKRSKLHRLMSIQMRKKICRPAVSFVF